MSNNVRNKLEIAAMVLSIGIAWGTLTLQVRSLAASVQTISTHISKMELYMSAHDKNYWKDSGDQP